MQGPQGADDIADFIQHVIRSSYQGFRMLANTACEPNNIKRSHTPLKFPRNNFTCFASEATPLCLEMRNRQLKSLFSPPS